MNSEEKILRKFGLSMEYKLKPLLNKIEVMINENIDIKIKKFSQLKYNQQDQIELAKLTSKIRTLMDCYSMIEEFVKDFDKTKQEQEDALQTLIDLSQEMGDYE